MRSTRSEMVRSMEMHKTNGNKQMIICDNLVKIYKTKDTEVLALQGLDMVIQEGEFVAIIGRSGSGKSTFLNMVGGLDRPSAGRLHVDGLDLFKLGENELVSYKSRTVGFVWQNNARNLLPYLTAKQNIELPMQFLNKKEREGQVSLFPPHKTKSERALYLLDLVGLAERKDSRLSQLSGGEQQRIAIAIALSNEPRILLADEPTGSVDVKTSNLIFDLFRRLNQEFGLTIVMVTHDQTLSQKVSRVINIQDGKISSERHVRLSYSEQLQHVASLDEIDPESDHNDSDHEEFLIMDRVGRVQIPREALRRAGFKDNKIRLIPRDGYLELLPSGDAAEEEEAEDEF